MRRARIVIVSPALADARNGNWQTARRWQSFLRARHDVEVCREWPSTHRPAAVPEAPDVPDAMIALHARRSAGSVERFAATGRPLAVVLTGTDLYRDIVDDVAAQRSLALAHRLVGLQDRAPAALPPAHRARTEVIVQSAAMRRALAPRRRTFDLLLVGHLRPEKDPLTAVRALARLPDRGLRLVHVGDTADPACGAAFDAAAARDARIARRGAVDHAVARRLIARGRVLLLPSLMEGGANVLIEALTSGVPVLASRIDGSLGLLGDDYPGVFPVGDDAALAALVRRCKDEPTFLDELRSRCAALAPRFAPALERSAVRALAHNLLAGTFRRSP